MKQYSCRGFRLIVFDSTFATCSPPPKSPLLPPPKREGDEKSFYRRGYKKGSSDNYRHIDSDCKTISIMKFVVLVCLTAVAVAAPQGNPEGRSALTVRDDRSDNGDGNFAYGFETDNGIVVDAAGTPGVEGQSNIQGSYRFPLGDGNFLEVTYVADENGYRPSTKFVSA